MACWRRARQPRTKPSLRRTCERSVCDAAPVGRGGFVLLLLLALGLKAARAVEVADAVLVKVFEQAQEDAGGGARVLARAVAPRVRDCEVLGERDEAEALEVGQQPPRERDRADVRV